MEGAEPGHGRVVLKGCNPDLRLKISCRKPTVFKRRKVGRPDMAKPDALRASLDRLEVDRKARGERDYVESVLRRLGPIEPPVKEAEQPVVEKAAPSPALPAFDRVKPVKHPKVAKAEQQAAEEEANAVEFKQLSKRQRRKRDRLRAKATEEEQAATVADDVEEPEEEAPVGQPPNPAAGFMKGKFALLRRQMDDDHAVYFFATEVPNDAKQARVPAGYEVRMTPETNLPYIARRGSDSNVTVQVRAKDRSEAMQIAARRGVGGLQE